VLAGSGYWVGSCPSSRLGFRVCGPKVQDLIETGFECRPPNFLLKPGLGFYIFL